MVGYEFYEFYEFLTPRYKMSYPGHCSRHNAPITKQSFEKAERTYNVFGYCSPQAKYICICSNPKAVELDVEETYTRLVKERDEPIRLESHKSDDLLERWFFITLTQPDSNKTTERLIKSTHKVLKSRMVQPIEWAYCLELTESGTPHSHIRLKAPKKFIDGSKLKPLNDNYRVESKLEQYGSDAYISNVNKTHPPGQWFFCSDNYSGTKPAQ